MGSGYEPRGLILLGAGASAVILVTLTGFTAIEVDRHESSLMWIEHTHAILDQLAQARIQIKIAELGRNEFISTGTEASRNAVRRAAESVRWTAEALQIQTIDNPPQAARAEELAAASAEIRASVETRAHRGEPAEGSPAVNRAENLSRLIEDEERRLLSQRAVRERRSADLVLAALAAELLFATLLTGTALILILGGINERERLKAELERLAPHA